MKNIFKFIAILGIFAMTTGSGFAMGNNPPTEPVKLNVETEVAEEAPQQVLSGYGYYNHITDECLFLSATPIGDCLISNPGPQCTVNVGIDTFLMFEVSRASINDPWACGDPIKKPKTQ